MNTGETIKRLRHNQGLTQGKLADRAGISQATISLIESGNRDITMGRLRSVAEALGTVPEVIIWKSLDIPEDISNDQKLMIQAAELIVEKIFEGQNEDERPSGDNHCRADC